MTTFWPKDFSISAAVTRVTWSVEPPAAQGTMTVMGRLGFQSCAKLMLEIANEAMATERHFTANRFFISSLL